MTVPMTPAAEAALHDALVHAEGVTVALGYLLAQRPADLAEAAERAEALARGLRALHTTLADGPPKAGVVLKLDLARAANPATALGVEGRVGGDSELAEALAWAAEATPEALLVVWPNGTHTVVPTNPNVWHKTPRSTTP